MLGMRDMGVLELILPLIVLSYLSLFIFGFLDNIRGPLFSDILESFNLTDGQGGAFFAMASLGSFAGGLLAKRLFSSFKIWQINQWALLCILVGAFGTGWERDYSVVLLFSFIFGVGLGVLGVAVNVMVQRGSSEKKLRQMMSGLHSCYGLSALLAPFVVAYGYGKGFTWQEMIMGTSLLPLLIIVGVLFKRKSMDREIIEESQKETPKEIPKKIPKKINGRTAIDSKMGVFVLANALYVSSELAISTRLALYMRRYGETPEVASYYLSLFFLGLFISRLVLIKSIALSHRVIILGASLSSIVSWLLGLWVHPLFFCILGITMGPIFPVSMAYARDVFANKASHVVAYSISAMSLAIMVMHSLIGWLTDLFNLRWALHLAVLVLLVHFVLMKILSRRVEGEGY